MSTFGSSEADAALLKSLGDMVQGEVIDRMEAHGWEHGTPPPLAAATDNPDPAVVPKPDVVVAEGTTPETAPAPTGEAVANTPTVDGIDWESLRGADGKYAGKYASKQELVKGVGNVVNMAKSAFSRADALEKELAELRARPAAIATSPAPTPGVAQIAVADTSASLAAAPVKSEKLAKVLARIVGEGGLLDAESVVDLMDGISDQSRLQAEHIADAKLAARDTAQDEQNKIWTAVESHMTKTYPRSVDFVGEMGLHVQSNPVLKKAVEALSAQGDHIGATALAWESFERTLPPVVPQTSEERAAAERKEIDGAAQEQVRKEAVDAARKQAGVSSSSVSGAHESVHVGASADEIAQAAREMNATGLGTKWRMLAFGKDLTGPMFD